MTTSSQKHSPLEQFEIVPFVEIKSNNIDLSVTNSSVSMILTVAIITLFLTLTVNTRAIVPSRLQLLSELSYNFIAQLLKDTVGNDGRKYFPLVFTIFMFVLVGNMVGMIPYSFTFTSHIIVTFALAIVVFIGVIILGFVKHGLHFFSFFVIPGLPWFMLPILLPIEIISFFSSPICLSVKICGSTLAGPTFLNHSGRPFSA